MISGKIKCIKIMRCLKIILLLSFVGISIYITDAKIPVTYSCCANYITNNGIQIDNFDNISNWIISGTAIVDTTTFKEGTQGLKLIAKNGGSAFIDKNININFSTTTGAFQIDMYLYDDINNFKQATIYFTSTGTAYSKFFSRNIFSISKGWNRILLYKSDFSNTGEEDWNNVMTRIRLRIYATTGNNSNITMDDFRYGIVGRPKIMFNFDDGYSSVFNTALPILVANRQVGTSFIINNGININNRMSTDNLKTLQTLGWDISSHSMTHSDLTKLNDSQLIYEINNSYDWLVNNGLMKSAQFFAYPGGASNDNIINKTKQRYILARSYSNLLQAPLQFDNGDMVLYKLKVMAIANITSVQAIEDRINSTINDGAMTMLVFHDIFNNSPVTNPNGYLKSDFQNISDYIANRSSDIDVITYSDLVIPNINNFTPVINKYTRIYSNGSSVVLVNNKYDEYMPNLTIIPSSDYLDVNITMYNEIIQFNESRPNIVANVRYNIGDRIPNTNYSVQIFWNNGTKFRDFYIIANSTGYLNYNLTGLENPKYQVIRPVMPTPAITLDWNNGDVQHSVLTNGVQTFIFDNPRDGGRYMILLKQPTSGEAGTVIWPTTVLWPGGKAPILTTENRKVDIVTFVYDGTDTIYYGGSSLNY